MKIALVGSRSFPVVPAALAIAEFIRELPGDTVILTRESKGFDEFSAECARIMGYEVVPFRGQGGASNYERDVRLVQEADKCIVFFAPGDVGQGGTQHIVDKSLDQRVPVDAWGVDSSGRGLILLGSDDGSGAPTSPLRSAPRTKEAAGEAASQPDGQGRSRSAAPVWPGSGEVPQPMDGRR